MKSFRNFLLVISAFFSATMLSGCELLMFPFQLVGYILGGAITVFMRLLPIAAKLLPLALLFVQAEQPENNNNIIATTNINIPKHMAYEDIQKYPDGFDIITKKINSKESEKFNYIFVFDPKTPKDQILKKIQNHLNEKKPLKIESCIVNGASFYNEKYRFFMLLERLRKKGVFFKGYGPMKNAVDTFNDSGQV